MSVVNYKMKTSSYILYIIIFSIYACKVLILV